MAQNQGTYDPAEMFLIVAGINGNGYGEEEMIRTERTNPDEYRAIAGAQGDFTFNRNLDKTGLVIITLAQLSPFNTFLQSLLEAGSVFPLSIVQQHGFIERVAGTACMIGQAPRKVFSKSATSKEWQIAVGELIETNKAI